MRHHLDTAHRFDAAAATRRAFIDQYADTPVLIIGTHFAAPTAGHIVADGDRWKFSA